MGSHTGEPEICGTRIMVPTKEIQTAGELSHHTSMNNDHQPTNKPPIDHLNSGFLFCFYIRHEALTETSLTCFSTLFFFTFLLLFGASQAGRYIGHICLIQEQEHELGLHGDGDGAVFLMRFSRRAGTSAQAMAAVTDCVSFPLSFHFNSHGSSFLPSIFFPPWEQGMAGQGVEVLLPTRLGGHGLDWTALG